MKKKLFCLISIMLLIATIYPVTDTPSQETQTIGKHKQGTSNQPLSDEWWPMYRNDPANTGSTLGISPSTNQLKWKSTIGEDIFSVPQFARWSNDVADLMLYEA